MEVELKGKISLFSGTALCVTCIIGSGWLFTPQLAAKYAGNWSFLAWALAAGFVLLVGLCYTTIVAAYPVAGITSRSASLSHSNTFGLPFAFANWFGIIAACATQAQATVQYIAIASKSSTLIQNNVLTLSGKLFAICILAVYLLINFYGVKLLAKVNNVVTVVKVFSLLLVIVILFTAHFDSGNLHLPSNNIYSINSTITAFTAAGLIYAYNGFQTVVAFAGEIENPKKNVPLSMVLALVIVLIIYLVLQLVFMAAVPANLLSEGWLHLNFASPMMNLALLLGSNFLALILISNSIICPSATGYSYLGASSRMLAAMATDGQMPAWIAYITPKYAFSRRSLFLNFILAAIILFNSDNWATLLVLVSGLHIIGYMAAPISMSAIKPTTRLYGIIVFTVIGMLMSTLSAHNMLIINSTMTLVIGIFLIIQLKSKAPFLRILIEILPLLVYFWLFNFINNLYIMMAASICLFGLVTSRKYVEYCLSGWK